MNSLELATSLRLLISTLHKELRKHMQPVCRYSMTELETIALLAKTRRLLPSELATLTRVKTQSMSQILKKLEQDGLLQREPCQEDRRKIYVSLTLLGDEAVEKTRKEREAWLQHRIETLLSTKETKLLEETLPVLSKLAQLQS